MDKNASSDTEVYHYAACRDCPRWKYTDTREEAKESAEKHEEGTGHNAFYETLEGANVR